MRMIEQFFRIVRCRPQPRRLRTAAVVGMCLGLMGLLATPQSQSVFAAQEASSATTPNDEAQPNDTESNGTDAHGAETNATEPSTGPAPPSNVRAIDRPNDVGNALIVQWDLSPDDDPEFVPRRVIAYEIFRRHESDTEFTLIGDETYEKASFTDTNCRPGEPYHYQVVAVAPDETRSEPATTTEPGVPVKQYFDSSKTWFGILLFIVCASVIGFIQVARSGRDLRIRKIAGLEAVDEAVGRATEMGRPCLFVPGILDINDIQTIAGITILSRVAQLTAEYDAQIEVPTARSLVMTASRETVEASYLAAGRPDAFDQDDIYYLTDEQFGYVAGVTGTMVRKKPAACFYMGAFFAESLLLAETGNSVGAVQVAGTAMPSQLPFFVAACDYTLIGEEFFAASAYLSGEPQQLGSLKGQDVGKAIGATLLIAGCVLATLAATVDIPAADSVLNYLTDHILGDKGFLL